jgi:hypothetical protein
LVGVRYRPRGLARVSLLWNLAHHANPKIHSFGRALRNIELQVLVHQSGDRVQKHIVYCCKNNANGVGFPGRIVLAALVSMVPAYLFGGGVEFSQPLFVIEKSTNANVVHYDARIMPDGELDPRQPVEAYWVMAAEDGRKENLSSVEKQRAFGFTLERDQAANAYRMHLIAQRRRDIYVHRQGSIARAETVIAGHCAYLTKIYVSAHKVLMLPIVEFIELFGTDIATGENVYEKVRP